TRRSRRAPGGRARVPSAADRCTRPWSGSTARFVRQTSCLPGWRPGSRGSVCAMAQPRPDGRAPGPAGAADLDVLVPPSGRPAALAVTLTGLAAQPAPGFRVIVSDQSASPVADEPIVAAAIRILRHRGHPVEVHRHVPPRGMAEQRAFLLSRATRRAVLFLDDDVWLDVDGVAVLAHALAALGCGFVGFAVQGLSYRDDVRPHELAPYEEWRGRVRPERVLRGGPAWGRQLLHNAANPLHLA